MIIITTVMPVVAGTDPVAFRKTWMNGKPVSDDSTLSILPTQNASVIIMTRPVEPFNIKVQTMPIGRTRDASRISSAAFRD
jgi:hypothetical protein